MLQPNEKSSAPERGSFPASTPNAFAPAKSISALGETATIGRTIVIKGEISGAETLYIDGRVEGNINLPESKVTIGRNGNVAAQINAKEVVVIGKVEGNMNVGDRVEIRSDGSVKGDISAQRLTIEDGAFIQGGIDLGKSGKSADRKSDEKPMTMAAHA